MVFPSKNALPAQKIIEKARKFIFEMASGIIVIRLRYAVDELKMHHLLF